jgi:hypothetical protein
MSVEFQQVSGSWRERLDVERDRLSYQVSPDWA